MNNIQHLGHAQFQGQIGRGAASRDALLEDSNYYAKANEWGERSSIAQTKGSMKAYGGDVDKMAETVMADSLIKANQQLENIKQATKQGLLDNAGNLEDLGKTAYAIPIAENVAKVATKAKVLSNEQTRNDLISQLEEGITMNLTGSQREGESAEGHQLRLETNRNKAKEAVAATGLSDAKNGEDVASAIAAMGAMNYASANTLNIAGANVNLGIDAGGNVRVASMDSSYSQKWGESIDTGSNGKVVREMATFAANRIYGEGNYSKDQLNGLMGEIANNSQLANELRTKGLDYVAGGGSSIFNEWLKSKG